jgi:hypothetical protein
LRKENRVSDNRHIFGYNCIWGASSHDINVDNTSDSNSLNVYFSVLGIIFDVPILSSCKIVDNSDPSICSVLVHEVWVDSVHVISRRLSVFNGSWEVSRPHAIDSILQEEIRVGSLSETEYASKVLSLLSNGMHSDPVKIVVIDHAVNTEELSCGVLGEEELHLEGAGQDSHELGEIALKLEIVGIDILIRDLVHLLARHTALSVSPFEVDDVVRVDHELGSD